MVSLYKRKKRNGKMKAETFSGLMLFSKEKLHYPYKYRLYFIDLATVNSEEPEIHRFCVRSGKLFDRMQLAGVYELTARGLFITDCVITEMAYIDDDFYHSLLYLRDLIFMDKRSGKYVGINTDAYNTTDYYWNFDEYRQILSYKPSKKTNILYVLYKLAMYFFTIVIPVGLYALALYGISTLPADVAGAFTLPSTAILSLPLVLWMMNFIFIMGETVMLMLPDISRCAVKKYALKWAGMRRDGVLGERTKKEIIRNLIISLSCIALCILLNLFM